MLRAFITGPLAIAVICSGSLSACTDDSCERTATCTPSAGGGGVGAGGTVGGGGTGGMPATGGAGGEGIGGQGGRGGREPAVLGAGSEHTCVGRPDGTTWCWGRGDSGQLGNGQVSNPAIPVQVQTSNQIVAIDGGPQHTCAVTAAGGVECWGSAANGRLGNGATVGNVSAPANVPNITGASAIGTGFAHTCTVAMNGSVWCWGDNQLGMLGDGSLMPASSPVQIGLAGATTIAAGAAHSCASLGVATVSCWGGNEFGELGKGDFSDSTAPVPANVMDISMVGARGVGTWALGQGGSLWHWGDDDINPIQQAGITDATAVAVGNGHRCVLHATGDVSCWGANANGESGNGTVGGGVSNPGPVALPTAARAIAAGNDHSCALLANDAVYCWGINDTGELGSSGGPSGMPVEVQFP
jgi:alpha-tubulin suppressor-like RCC1 family protein